MFSLGSNKEKSDKDVAKVTANLLSKRSRRSPKIAIVLGSGLGGVVDMAEDKTIFKFSEIPHFPKASVPGHEGQFVFGVIKGVDVVFLQGRLHSYEGHNAEQISRPVRIFHHLGVETVVLTNASGGLSDKFKAGDVVLVRDHLSLSSLSGLSPTVGTAAFTDMSVAYSPRLKDLARLCGASLDWELKEGVYGFSGGPNFETPSEVKALKMLGCDVVGMSTAPEVIVARHCDMRVIALSVVANPCESEICDSEEQFQSRNQSVTHDDVLATVASQGAEKLKGLLTAMLGELTTNEKWAKQGAL